MFVAFTLRVSLLIAANHFSLMGMHMFDHKVAPNAHWTLSSKTITVQLLGAL